MQIFESEGTITGTLRDWRPKCNTEMERRVRLDFEIPLTEELIDALPDALRKTANAIGNLEDGLTEGTISTSYSQTLEIYDLPEQNNPRISIPNALLVGMHIFRPTPKDGPSDDLFLVFRTTVRAEGNFGDDLVTWALRNLRGTIFFKAFESQRELPLESVTGSAA
jgi:hypothetical protein